MAIGCSDELTSHDESAVTSVAIDAGDRGSQPGRGDHPDVPIQLSCHPFADGHAVIAMRGDLDLATVDRVVCYVSGVIDRHAGPVTLDLHGVGFCDACGLGALIRIAAHAEQTSRRLKLIRPSWALTRIMRITGVDHLLASAQPLSVGGPAPADRD